MNCLWLNPIALPFALLLMWLYTIFQGPPDNESKFAYALALIFIAIIVRVLLLPFQMKGKRGMLRQTRLQPKINELQKRHGANKQKLNEEMAKLYKDEGVNPASGCLWNFIQMPIMIALFYAIRQPFTLMMRIEEELWQVPMEVFNTAGRLYQRLVELVNQGVLVIPESLLDPETGFYRASDFYVELYIAQDVNIHWENFRNLGIEGLHRISFWLGNLNLAEIPNFRVWDYDWSDSSKWGPSVILFLLPVLSGAAQFVSAHIMRKTNPQPNPEANKGTAGMIMKLMPLMSVWFGFILPAALSVYWTIGTILQIVQDLWLTKRYTKILDAEDAERDKQRKEKEDEIEAKRLETERLKAEGKIVENKNVSKRKKQKTERQSKREKEADWEKKNAPAKAAAKKKGDEPGRVGERRYARGRAYDPDRFKRSKSGKAEDESGSRNEELGIGDDDSDLPNDETLEQADVEQDYDEASNDESEDNGDDEYDDDDEDEDEDDGIGDGLGDEIGDDDVYSNNDEDGKKKDNS